MNSLNTVACPHCGVANAAGSAFCGSCGKALPVASAGPRIISGNQFATTSAGQKLQGDDLHKQAKKAAGALLAVAVVQTIFTVIIYAALQNAPRSAQINIPMQMGVIGGIAVVFWGLYIWARSSPFPAAIVGLVVYLTLWGADLVVWFISMSKNPDSTSAATPFSGIIIKIIIIGVLIQAIQAGAKHRQLMRQQAAGAGVM
jgi:hypothetical protein